MRKAFVRGMLSGICALALTSTASAAEATLNAYEVRASAQNLQTLAENGFDTSEGLDGRAIEVIASETQAQALRKQGVAVSLKRDAQGRTALQALRADVQPDGSYDVYRPYWNDECTETTCYVGRDEEGNPRQTLYQEMLQLAEENPDIVQEVEIGRTLNDVPILALRVTRDAREQSNPPGTKPAVLYNAAQHAREWITPEMIRRLAHFYVDNYGGEGDALGTDGQPVAGADGPVQAEELTGLVNDYELWFVVVANPDGYDFTFTPGNRLWRKNLRDNDGDGEIVIGDGVDLNRNFAEKWNYDDEGSSSDPANDTYRGTAPNSEPETQAMDGLLRDVGFEFMVNYHSAAELLLYPFGWQVQTTAADDPIFRALSGTDADPAIAGVEPGAPNPYDPDVSSELYTTNGETTDHAYSRYDTLAWTPEMDVSDPERGGGDSVFMFQDSEADLQDAFEKNIPFALDVAHSAGDPANPVSHLDREAAEFEVDRFPTSFGDPQPVEALVKRELGAVTINWRVNNGAPQSAAATEFDDGERYGEDGDVYYARVRGEVTGASAGDSVRVWFEAGGERSQAFNYQVASDSDAPVLVLAAEDYSGLVNIPEYPSTDGPFYTSYYTNALTDLGIAHDVYDFDEQGRRAPDPLGVLSHYQAVIWYTGDDFVMREPGAPGQSGASRAANDMILSVRDFVNEGGKLLHTGQHAEVMASTPYTFNVQGQPPYCPPGGTATANNCIPLSNDFLQYWLGAYTHITTPNDPAATELALTGDPYGTTTFGLNGADSAANQQDVATALVTSSVLPEDEYPQFASERSAEIVGAPSAFDPTSGSMYAVASSEDGGWQRFRKTIDLTDLTAGQAADIAFKISYDTEADFDYVIVEAHTVGQEDWTTLPDANGHTTDDTGASCTIDWRSIHPFLDSYQTVVPPGDSCENTGTTGEWHGATGNSAGFQDWEVDLSAYAGSQVEISISYVQDFAFDGLGVFVDDVVVTENGTATETIDFETGDGGFEAGPPPPGSEEDTQRAWEIRESVGWIDGPGIATEDTLYWTFGFEGVSDAAVREQLLGSSLAYLGVGAGPEPPDPPNTKITKAPKKETKKTNATFRFLSTPPGADFECKLDGDDWEECDSPQSYKKLDRGRHVFKVRAVLGGETDPTPAKHVWKIKKK